MRDGATGHVEIPFRGQIRPGSNGQGAAAGGDQPGHGAGAVPVATRDTQRAGDGSASQVDAAAAGERGIAIDRAAACERAAGADNDRTGGGERAVDLQSATSDRGRAGVKIRPGQRQCARAHLGQPAGAGHDACVGSRAGVVAADRQGRSSEGDVSTGRAAAGQ